ncbi:MAG: ribonuclease III [Bdellovibrionota bacterium]
MSDAMIELATCLGIGFTRQELLELALTHKSYSNEQSGGSTTVQTDNERLEFLGDAVLDLALSDVLMKRFPGDSEGALSKKRASLVNEETLAKLALEMKIDSCLRVGRGEAKTGGLQKPRILASAVEAILGAIYQDAGFDAAKTSVEKIFAGRLDGLETSAVDFESDFKTRLQERAQEVKKSTPNYSVESETGPDHDKVFEIAVRLDGELLATGLGRSKKAAEQDAAKKALEQLK